MSYVHIGMYNALKGLGASDGFQGRPPVSHWRSQVGDRRSQGGSLLSTLVDGRGHGHHDHRPQHHVLSCRTHLLIHLTTY